MTAKPKIGIIISTTRQSRFGDRPAKWIHDLAARRADADFEIVDLRDYPMGFFSEERSPAYGTPTDEAARRWGDKIASLDGFIFVTAEYNHSFSGVLKNALDYAYAQFNRKPAAFVGYGGVGGARAVEQLRLVLVELQVAALRSAVHIGMAEMLGIRGEGKTFDDYPHLANTAKPMLDDIVWWANALSSARGAEERKSAA